MQYKKFSDTDIRLSVLGMGNMRLPTLDGTPSGPIDREQSKEMIRYAMAHGVNYYDTAYVYHGGESEKFLGEIMKEWPRDSFYLATKYLIHAGEGAEAVFAEQLERLQTDYIDFYLVHSVTDDVYQRILDSGCIDFLKNQKAAGRIKNLGFSFHGGTDCLKQMMKQYDWDFAQIQLNYFDWIYGTAREEYEIIAGTGTPIIVMEPVRGGKLAGLTPDAEAMLKRAHPDWSIASWAFRWLKRLNAVQLVLSGMTHMDQMKDNVATADDSTPLTDEEEQLLFKASEMFVAQMSVPCTACNYCGSACPVNIEIPAVMDVYNESKTAASNTLRSVDISGERGRFTECIGCGSCQTLCPQSIAIPDIMSELRSMFADFI